PVTKRSPVIWMAFPESDRCFASIETRMGEDADIRGQEYALVEPQKATRRVKEYKNNHYLGELKDTVFKLALRIYYTGNDPRYLAIKPRSYTFFGWGRGHVSDMEVAASREVWYARPDELARSVKGIGLEYSTESLTLYPTGRRAVVLASVDLKPETVYLL